MVTLNNEEKKIALKQFISLKKIEQLKFELYSEMLNKYIKKLEEELAEIANLEKQEKLPFK
ncbi:MAG: hypothetical protein KAT66_00460 [Candidatus Lokiarchaeota archaeon]|nr:hypothetical protein [Candidatus Lokiarchaeota archaeon]